MSRINIIIAVAVAALTISLWWLVNQPETEPAWPETIKGFSFSPMRAHHDPLDQNLPSVEEIDADLALLEGKTYAVRTYTVEGTNADVPRLAAEHGINVALGAWIDARLDNNVKEIDKLIRLADANRKNVIRALVGNEVVLRGDIPVTQLIDYINHVKEELAIPVGTAEPWHVWVKHPELAAAVDFIGVHMLPYWEGIHIDVAVDYVVMRMNELKILYPNKPIIIAEVGWPSNGRTRHSAVASESNEAIFLRRFIQRAEQEGYVYYVMEAFDQPWKWQIEGAVGAYWGVYDVERHAKFSFSGPIVEIPQWRTLAGLSIIIALITFALLLIDARSLTHHGRGFLAIIAYALATAVVWIIYDYTQQYMSFSAIVVGVLMLIGMIGVILVVLIEAHEWAEALWVRERQRQFSPPHLKDNEWPLVSIHVPTHNEPPDMVIETLNALAKLDYPYYEVIVVDNNTNDPDAWKPVEQHCRSLGSQFKFFHVNPLDGFKSGALNYALKQTSADAGIIGVIDSDYRVDSRWLRSLVPYFGQQSIAVVQAPQDYHDATESAFKAMCYAEYRGFFYIGMITRNERNAIIQHGTMTLVRKSTLETVGRWSEWCITEDAELGLEIFSNGYEAVYIPESFGQGLMPDSFSAYKQQRFRWAYGAMQIIRRHAAELFLGRNTQLASGQRYHFIAGWLPWMADAINLLFNFAALVWCIAMIMEPAKFDPPLIIFSILPLTLFCFKMAKIVYLYRGVKIVSSVTQTIAAVIAGLSLSHTIARAVWRGLFTSSMPFLRTPKKKQANALVAALASAREEFLMTLALWSAAGIVWTLDQSDSLDLLLWVIVLLVQSIPYLATLIVATISALPALEARWICGDKRTDSSQINQDINGAGKRY